MAVEQRGIVAGLNEAPSFRKHAAQRREIDLHVEQSTGLIDAGSINEDGATLVLVDDLLQNLTTQFRRSPDTRRGGSSLLFVNDD